MSVQTQSILQRAAVIVATLVFTVPAIAGGTNEVTLQNFGSCIENSDGYCQGVEVDEQQFRDFANELGLAFAPLSLTPAETLGVSGFSLQLEHNISFINNDEEYWQKAMLDHEPAPSAVHVSQIHLRKGLPFSFELGAMTSVWWKSDLVAFGGEIKWALHEDTMWPLPDLGIRGWGNVVLGHQQLKLYNAGADVTLSLPIGIGGAAQLSPMIGYSLHAVISGSSVMDSSPSDPTPPFEQDGGTINQPEFVFANETQVNHRIFGGFRLRVTHLEATIQVTGLSDVLTVSAALGTTF